MIKVEDARFVPYNSLKDGAKARISFTLSGDNVQRFRDLANVVPDDGTLDSFFELVFRAAEEKYGVS